MEWGRAFAGNGQRQTGCFRTGLQDGYGKHGFIGSKVL
jgi:hypothetical protein